MHVGIAHLRWRGKRSRHSRRMRTRNFTYLARGPWVDFLIYTFDIEALTCCYQSTIIGREITIALTMLLTLNHGQTADASHIGQIWNRCARHHNWVLTILVKIVSGKGLFPDDTRYSYKPMSPYKKWDHKNTYKSFPVDMIFISFVGIYQKITTVMFLRPSKCIQCRIIDTNTTQYFFYFTCR